METPLSLLGEDALLARLLRGLPTNGDLLTGPGDDCAVVACNEQYDMLLKTDVVVEAVHFDRDTPPDLIGRKALARCISDVAAMGGLPKHALVTVLVHRDRTAEWVEGVYAGLNRLAAEYGVSVAGGETSSLPVDAAVLNVALVGTVERGQAVLRSGAQPGDLICVTGTLGGSYPGEGHLRFIPRVEVARRLLAEGLRPTAMMDLSDGLGTDLPRLAAASHCGFEVDPASLPCSPGCTTQQAISDGEDYELLMTFPPALFARARSLNLGIPLTPIGRITPEGTHGLTPGWQHFTR